MTRDNSLITKKMKKDAANLIKSFVKDRQVRKDLNNQVKELSENQSEKKLAVLLLNNELVNVYIRVFMGDPKYFEEWISEKYNVKVSMSEATKKEKIDIRANVMVQLYLNEAENYLKEIEEEQNKLARLK